MGLILRKGDKGKAVREIQGLLNSRAGKILLQPDGDFGGKTETAVKEFQTKSKLKADGIVGTKTWNALHNEALKAQFDNCFAVHDWFSITELQKFFANLSQQSKISAESNPNPRSKPSISTVTQSAKASDTKQHNGIASSPAIVKRTDFKNYQRTTFHGYVGQGYVIKDFKKFENGAIQLRPSVKIIEPNGAIPNGFKNECASYVQYFGIPNTKSWLRGPRVCDFKPGELPEGTVVATLRDGKYYSDYSGRSHVGIYLNHDDYGSYLASKDRSVGVMLMDQFNNNRIFRRKKFYSVEANTEGKPSSKCWTDLSGVIRKKRVLWAADGEEYYVLLSQS